ncbi:MAG: carboxypeptidase regulatory-like domain-containing protein [Caldilineaceae bacterium]
MWLIEPITQSKFLVRLATVMLFVAIALLLPAMTREALAADFTISGSVYDAAMQPLERIEVTAGQIGFDPAVGRPVFLEVISSTTDSSGVYSLTLPYAGLFKIRFSDTLSPTRYQTEYYLGHWTPLNAQDVTVPAEGQEQKLQDAILTPAFDFTIQGKVTDEASNPIAQIRVTANQSIYFNPTTGAQAWSPIADATTDTTGLYTITVPGAGPYRVGFEDTIHPARYHTEFYNDVTLPIQAMDLQFDTQISMTEIDAQLSAASVISGQVSDTNGQPVPQVDVKVYQPIDNGSGQPSWQIINEGQVDNDGQYTMTLPYSGTVRVGFVDHLSPPRFKGEFFDHAQNVETATDVAVKIGEMTPNVNGQIDMFGTISGQVTDKSGNPIEKVTVSGRQLVTNELGAAMWPDMMPYALTDANGIYTLPVPNPVVTHVCFNLQTSFTHFAPRCYGSNVANPSHATDILVQPGEKIEGIDIQLGEFAKISGTVTNKVGEPLENIAIIAYAAPFELDPSIDLGQGFWSAQTDSNGHYEIPKISPFNFKMAALPTNDSPYAREYFDHQVSLGTAQVFTAEADSVFNFDFQLSQKGNITGTVTNPEGQPLSGASVTIFQYYLDLFGNYEWVSYANATTDESGAYTVTQVAPGTYRIGFGLNQEYAPQYYPYTTTFESASDILIGIGESTGNIDGQLSPLQNTLSIQLNSTPKSIRNLHFTSAVGDFALDDPALDDGDAFTQAVSFTLTSAVYSFTLALPSDRYLQGVSCEGPNSPEVNGSIFQIALSGGNSVTCTVQVTLGATVQTFSYHDANGNGLFNEGEAPQVGITVTVHNVTSGDNLEQVSDEGGLTEFVNLPPGSQFYICQTPPQDWVNSQPGTIDGQFNSPCYANSLQAGQLATIRFGNIEANDPDFTNTPSTAPDGFVISDAPLVNDTDEENPASVSVYLPLVSQ